jgi:hypothetical protein
VKKDKSVHSPIQSAWQVKGVVQWDDDRSPASGLTVEMFLADKAQTSPVGTGETDQYGRFGIRFKDREDASEHATGARAFFVVVDRSRHVVLSTRDTPFLTSGPIWEISLLVPASARTLVDRKRNRHRPQVQIGPLILDAEEVEKAKPAVVLDIARLLSGRKLSDTAIKQIERLSPDLIPDRLGRRTLCVTAIHEALDELIRRKRWPREIALEIDNILVLRDLGFAEETYECPNFIITYQTAGPAAVSADTSAQDVIEPGSNPPVVIGSLPAGAPPTYIKRLCFWLERALDSYVSPPFSMLNPAASGKIPVNVIAETFGGANPSGFHIGNALPNDLMCAVAVHELFHMVQYEYGGTGLWRQSVFEGGATFAEDSAAELMNRYLDEAGANFNGSGVMVIPNQSISTASYKCSLFWRYVAEQHSPLITLADEPKIGVETYRKIIEECSAGSYTTANVKTALRNLPWYQDFYEFEYLDPMKLDLTRAETTLGNYALACYLKDLGTNVPDRRFDFMEDEENIYIDEVINAILGTPLQTTLASVALSGNGTVTTASAVSFSGSVNTFGNRYYEVNVDPGVTNVTVQFTAGAGLTSSVFQIGLIDENGAVRDIHRTDKAAYTKQITNLRDGVRLSKLAIVVTGADSSGNFSLSATSSAAVPDVMVTRWHSVVKNEYEIDSRNWAWTWVSPDIWVDNDEDGSADGQVFFNFDNKLHIRLHNKGNLEATGIQVEFFYQDASGGLSPAAWLPVQNTGGTTQVLTGLTLAAGASNDWVVDWSPSPSGTSNHFCIRAIVTVPGDPNTDNKRVLSNFGNVTVKPGKFVDIRLIRHAIERYPQRVILQVVPRLTQDFELSLRDLREQRVKDLKPGESSLDEIRLTHRKLRQHIVHDDDHHQEPGNCVVKARRLEQTPDPRGNYKTDPRALPPGVAGKPMVTVVHEAEGLALGGVSFMVTLDNAKTSKLAPVRKSAMTKARGVRMAGRRRKH